MNQLEDLAKSAKPDARKHTSVVKAIHDVADRIHRRSLVVIFSDMFDNEGSTDDIIDALQHMKHNKHEVIVFHVADKSREIELKYDNRPYKFIDMENDSHLILNPNEIRDTYEKKLRGLFEEIRSRCASTQIDVVEMDIMARPEDIIKPYLTKRNKMV